MMHEDPYFSEESNSQPRTIPEKKEAKEMRLYPRTVARFAAIQAVFEGVLWETKPQEFLINTFCARFQDQGYDLFEDECLKIDISAFRDIVRSVFTHRLAIDNILSQALPSSWVLEKLEKTTRALFLCAGAEILTNPSCPKSILFHEYISAAHSFLLEKGPGFVNALLEKMYPSLVAYRESLQSQMLPLQESPDKKEEMDESDPEKSEGGF